MTITNTEGLSELLPCPFCGGEASLTKGGPGNAYVRCTVCQCTGDDGFPDRVVAAWNRRAANNAGRVEVKEPVAFINAQGGVLMTEAGEEWFKTVRAMTAPAGLPAVPLFASSVSAEVTERDGMLVAALKGLVLLKDLFDASDRNQADAYYILAKQDGAWGNASAALSALNGGRENG